MTTPKQEDPQGQTVPERTVGESAHSTQRDTVGDLPGWAASIDHEIHAAAEAAVKQGIALDAFMATAYAAYLRCDPGLAERLANLALLAHVEDLRRRGLLGLA